MFKPIPRVVKAIVVSLLMVWMTECLRPDIIMENIEAFMKEDLLYFMEGDEFKLEYGIFKNRCYPDVGCYYTGPPWYHPIHRPISFTPLPCREIGFRLFTPSNPKDEFLIVADAGVIRKSPFDPSLPTKIIVGGFTEMDLYLEVEEGMKDCILSAGNYNVIVVVIKNYVQLPYMMAIANARTLGAQLARLINCLIKDLKIPSESFHIIGTSLGAQIAAYAGKLVPKLGRITGLDAAGPSFNIVFPPEVRITKDDALFVDAIHTDGGSNVLLGLGTPFAYADMDFYVNGGSRQPGCSPEVSLPLIGADVTDTLRLVTTLCHHLRALYAFNESISNHGCSYQAVSCSSWEDFQAGKCIPGRNGCVLAEMGFNAKKIEGLPPGTKFYLRTASTYPLCLKDGFLPEPEDTPEEGIDIRFIEIPKERKCKS